MIKKGTMKLIIDGVEVNPYSVSTEIDSGAFTTHGDHMPFKVPTMSTLKMEFAGPRYQEIDGDKMYLYGVFKDTGNLEPWQLAYLKAFDTYKPGQEYKYTKDSDWFTAQPAILFKIGYNAGEKSKQETIEQANKRATRLEERIKELEKKLQDIEDTLDDCDDEDTDDYGGCFCGIDHSAEDDDD